MAINRLDIKQLRVLQLLLQERNLSKVAHIMGQTQQAISEQLRKLRHSFDDPLFIRVSNGVVPTTLAESLEEQVNLIIHQIDGLISPKDFDPSRLSGVFQISATDYSLVTLLPELVNQVRQQAPDLKLIIREFESDNLNQLLATGEVDLAITFPEFIPDNLPSRLLFREHHKCVVAHNSPLAGCPLSVEACSNMPQLIISPSRANLKGSHDAWFLAQGLKRNIVMSIPSFAAAPEIIGASELIAFLPSRLLPHPKLAEVNIQTTPPSFEVIAAWHARSNNSPVLKWLLGLIEQLAEA